MRAARSTSACSYRLPSVSFNNSSLLSHIGVRLKLFFGWLGQGRVCAVYETGVEMPSDLGGILYVPYDVPGKWRWDVAKEMRAAGYDVDLNRL
jgi:predicted nucleotide-binding protein